MHTHHRTAFHCFFVLVVVLLTSGGAAASPPEAEKFVKDRQAVLADLVRKGAKADLDRVFGDTLDYDTIARDSLGDAWAALTERQQEQFRCVLRGLVQRAYQRDLRRTLEYSILFEGSEAVEKGFLVKTVAKSKTNPREEPVSIAYVVHRSGKDWRVRDIVTEGSSMVNSYETQFRRVLKRKGFDEMIRQMKDRLGSAAAACT
ncbi:MAG: ABC transporter substrate-binding protein [Polyangiaceae bacterium]|nr:ABC transporter substrate-binding protein [Polyangiaceae bacterium]